MIYFEFFMRSFYRVYPDTDENLTSQFAFILRLSKIHCVLFLDGHLEVTLMPFQTIAISASDPRVCFLTNCVCHILARVYVECLLTFRPFPCRHRSCGLQVLVIEFCHFVPWSEPASVSLRGAITKIRIWKLDMYQK